MEKPEKPAPPDRPAASSALIPVASIRLAQGRLLDLPGNPAVENVRSSREPIAQRYYRIYFDARLRHHRIECYEPHPDLTRHPKAIRMVPEGWVTWEPA